jgi:hypothetical protein
MTIVTRCILAIGRAIVAATVHAHRAAISLVAFALVAGGVLGAAFPATALWTSAYHSNLYNSSGSHYVSSMTVTGSSDDWFNCNGNICWTIARYVRVNWSVSGSNTFAGVFGSSYGYGDLCGTMHSSYIVNAGPSHPTDSQYVYFNIGCVIGYGQYWDWAGGMCNSSGECSNIYLATLGPNIQWDWVPPSGSATNFSYYW